MRTAVQVATRAVRRKSRTDSASQRKPAVAPRSAGPGPCSERDRVLALDDVFDLERLGLARKLNPNVLQHRHDVLAERLELLS